MDSQKLQDKEWIGGYDLLNEVNWPLGSNVLRELYIRITNEIRAVDANHILFIEGNGFANDFSGLTPPWDANMVYSPINIGPITILLPCSGSWILELNTMFLFGSENLVRTLMFGLQKPLICWKTMILVGLGGLGKESRPSFVPIQ